MQWGQFLFKKKFVKANYIIDYMLGVDMCGGCANDGVLWYLE